jgi:hypothetical protein
MSQNRKNPRYLTLRTGKIAVQGRSIECAIFNVSASGACLLVPDAAEIPISFELIIDRICGRTCCQVVWRDAHKIGVSFMERAEAPLH